MKVSLTDDVLNDIRGNIQFTKTKLLDNKNTRKLLIKQIQEAKESIRKGEVAFSSSSAAVTQEFIKGELKTKRMFLTSLRQQLVMHEIMREIELSRFRILHTSLDRLKVPVDPFKFAQKHGK